MRKLIISTVFLLTFVGVAHANTISASPIELADAVVIYVPSHHHDLNKVKPHERFIDGHAIKVEKGVAPVTIVHTANTFIRPLEAGVPVRLCLKKFLDREAYYIIAILSINEGHPEKSTY